MTKTAWNTSWRLEFFPGAAGAQWFVRLRSANGEILLVSEAYTLRWSAKRAARRMGKAFGIPVVAAAE